MTSKYNFTKDNIIVVTVKDKILIGNTDTNILYEVKKIKELKPKLDLKGYKKVKIEWKN